MTLANSNEGLNETKGFVENVLDDQLCEGVQDGFDGRISPRPLLIEMAAHALWRVVLHHGMMPLEARDLAASRMSAILNDTVDRSGATMAPDLWVVR